MVISGKSKRFVALLTASCRFIAVDAMSIGRRQLFGKVGRATVSTLGVAEGIRPDVSLALENVPDVILDKSVDATVAATTSEDVIFTAYEILPDASSNLSPSLLSIKPSELLSKRIASMKNGGALWLGEHHNSAADHKLQANFVQSIHRERSAANNNDSGNMSVGLEMIQVQFQPALDAYISKKITAQEMKDEVQWEKRWSWSFENYLPVFEACRELNIPLIALNVDSEDLGLVEMGGFPNLPRSKLQKYISDPVGFAEFARNRYYKTYVDYVISPSYDLHKEMGILRTTITGQQLEEDMPFTSFFSGRILWDESMASNAFRWTANHPGGLIIGLVGADHVKYEGGITGRYKRMAKETELESISIILNPTLIDTRPSGSVSMLTNNAASKVGADGLTLQLRYLKEGVEPDAPDRRDPSNTGGVLPFADYIVFS